MKPGQEGRAKGRGRVERAGSEQEGLSAKKMVSEDDF